MIRPFELYLKENLARKTHPNPGMAMAFLEKATTRLERVKRNPIQEAEAAIVFEEIYESLREASQAIMELKGYKPYSHEALLSFLLDTSSLPRQTISIMDGYRILRNNSVYQAAHISVEKCREALAFAIQTLPEIQHTLKDLMKE